MKKSILKLMLMAAVPVSVMWGCQENDVVWPDQNPAVIAEYSSFEEFLAQDITMPSGDSELNYRVWEAAKWTLESADDWCDVTPTSGSEYTIITLKANANPLDSERATRLIAVVNSGLPKRVTVTQLGGISTVSLNEDRLDFGLKAEGQKVKLNSNASEWTATLIDTETGLIATWIEADRTIGQANHEFTLTTTNNTTNKVREAVFTVTAGTVSQSIDISQLDNLATPHVTLDTGDKLELSWDNVVGADGYRLAVYDGADPGTATKIETINILAGASSYDLTTYKYAGDYVGMAYYRLEAYVTIEGTPISNFSNVEGSHVYFDDATGSKDGSVGQEFIVTNRRHLSNVALFLDKNYRQTGNIDMAGYAFTPISSGKDVSGNYTGPFAGSYDAGTGSVVDASTKRTSDQFAIRNLKIDKPTDNLVGLFSIIGATGIVRNVKIESPDIKGKSVIGSIAGRSSGSIVSCHTSGSGTVASYVANAADNADLGGIVGDNRATMEYCTNAVSVTASSGLGNRAGGVVGLVSLLETSDATVKFCSNSGTVSCNTAVGGIIGDAAGSITNLTLPIAVSDCFNTGSVTALAANSQSAGIVGRCLTLTTIDRCYNTGTIVGLGSSAGILGRCNFAGASVSTVYVRNCYNKGNVSSTATAVNGNVSASGIVAGVAVPNAAAQKINVVITNCHNMGEMTSSAAGWFSGIFRALGTQGTRAVRIGDCYALDTDKAKQTGDWNATKETGATNFYTNVTSAQMALQATFVNWDFTNTWTMANGYPQLRSIPE